MCLVFFSVALQLVLNVWLNVFAALAQAGQFKTPEVDASQKIFSKQALLCERLQITVGTGYKLKVTPGLFVCADWKKVFSSMARSSIACSSVPSSPISSRNSMPPSALSR